MTEIGNVKVKTLIGDDIWSINKKDAVIDTAFFQHELNQAKKFKTKSGGIDWEKYFDTKSDVEFANRKRFINSQLIFIQIDSLWLKYGLNEEQISWSLRVDGFNFHDCTVNVQFYAGSDVPINFEAKSRFQEGNEISTNALHLKWTSEILDKFEPLGHGVNFQAELNVEDSNLVQILNQKLGFNLKNLTVLWTSHDFLFAIMHENENFI